MSESIELFERISGRHSMFAVTPSASPAISSARRPTRAASGRSSAGSRRCRSKRGSPGNGNGPPLRSRPDERRPRRRARNRPRALAPGADRALVLPVAGLVVGAIVGLVFSLGGTTSFKRRR